MHFAFRIWLGIVFLIVIILLTVSTGAANGEISEVQRVKREMVRACDCRYASDSPVCASNGVTYPSQCRFNCAKERVKRLRMVSSGSCRGKSLNDYRRGQRSG